MGVFADFFGTSVPTLSALDLQKKLKAGQQFYILDVRQPEEFRLGHIVGAKLIPLGQLDRRMQEVPTGSQVVCICATGHRSVPAARKLIAAGYHALNMKNGMIAWHSARLPVEKGL